MESKDLFYKLKSFLRELRVLRALRVSLFIALITPILLASANSANPAMEKGGQTSIFVRVEDHQRWGKRDFKFNHEEHEEHEAHEGKQGL